MARRQINLHSIEKYSLESDKKPPKTVFILGPIDAPLMAAIDDEQTFYKFDRARPDAETGMVIRLNQRYVEFVRYGLKGWENYQDAEGKVIDYASQEYAVDGVGIRLGLKDALLRAMSLEDIAELAGRIKILNKLTKEQEKN